MALIRTAARVLSAALVVLALSSRAQAGPIVLVDVTDQGGGIWSYSLTIDNTTGWEQIAGMFVLHGDTVFGLDLLSTISAPAGWDFIPPDPGFIDDLFFFSLDPGDDVMIGETLGGFSFESMTAPYDLALGDFDVDLIGGVTFEQIPLGDVYIPEPSSLLLLGSGLVVAGRRLRARHRQRRA